LWEKHGVPAVNGYQKQVEEDGKEGEVVDYVLDRFAR
jgi:hypothetical protein